MSKLVKKDVCILEQGHQFVAELRQDNAGFFFEEGSAEKGHAPWFLSKATNEEVEAALAGTLVDRSGRPPQWGTASWTG